MDLFDGKKLRSKHIILLFSIDVKMIHFPPNFYNDIGRVLIGMVMREDN